MPLTCLLKEIYVSYSGEANKQTTASNGFGNFEMLNLICEICAVSIQVMGSYFQKSVLKTIQEAGTNLCIMFYCFPLFGRIKRSEMPCCHSTKPRAPLHLPSGQRKGTGFSVKPRCCCEYMCAFINR